MGIGSGMFFRLFCGTVMMLAFGYAGESHFLNAWLAFALGMAGWAFILFEVFAGEAGKEAGNASGHVELVHHHEIHCLRWLVNLPSRLLLRLLDLQSLRRFRPHLIYNLADFVNKIAFCLAIW